LLIKAEELERGAPGRFNCSSNMFYHLLRPE
jgi:hypothetical protein